MVDRDRVEQLVRKKLRAAGRQYEQVRQAYRDGESTVLTNGSRSDGLPDHIPRDSAGRPRIVCRRYAEHRAVGLDEHDRPSCYDSGHPDCEGCVEDLHDGTIETW